LGKVDWRLAGVFDARGTLQGDAMLPEIGSPISVINLSQPDTFVVIAVEPAKMRNSAVRS
jgi:hypothetical protein